MGTKARYDGELVTRTELGTKPRTGLQPRELLSEPSQAKPGLEANVRARASHVGQSRGRDSSSISCSVLTSDIDLVLLRGMGTSHHPANNVRPDQLCRSLEQAVVTALDDQQSVTKDAVMKAYEAVYILELHVEGKIKNGVAVHATRAAVIKWIQRHCQSHPEESEEAFSRKWCKMASTAFAYHDRHFVRSMRHEQRGPQPAHAHVFRDDGTSTVAELGLQVWRHEHAHQAEQDCDVAAQQ